MSYLGERSADLRRHLEHLRHIRSRARTPADLNRDISLDNDIRHSLLMVSQRVIDIAGELSSRRRLRFDDFSEAIRNLAIYEEFPDTLIRRLEPLPDLRNALIHATTLDSAHILDALTLLDGAERFAQALGRLGTRQR